MFKRVFGTRRAVLCGSLAAVLALVGSGCKLFSAKPPVLEDLNVLLIVVDTLGAKHLGAYNPSVDFTPNLDKLAKGGVRFSRAYSTAPWTKPSVASIITGLLPGNHGVVAHGSKVADNLTTLAEVFKAKGFKTTGVVSHVYLMPEVGYAQGFDEYAGVVDPKEMHRIITSPGVSDKATAWLDRYAAEKERKPFFMFLHYFDPHYNYLHHPEFDRTSSYQGRIKSNTDLRALRKLVPSMAPEDLKQLEGLYHEETAFTDRYIGKVLADLDRLGLSKNTLVILTADHGEEFLEHGFIGHTRTLYDELVHVPLIFSLPGTLAPRVVDAPVSQVDIMPSLLALARDPANAPPMDGVSLVPYLMGGSVEGGPRNVLSEVTYNTRSIRRAFKTALVRGNYKLIHDRVSGKWELFDLVKDPAEKQDLMAIEPRRAEEMMPAIQAWEKHAAKHAKKRPAPQVKPNEEELKQLKSLGYM